MVTAKTPSFASAKDKNPIIGDGTYYGVLTIIIQLDYYEIERWSYSNVIGLTSHPKVGYQAR